jgi:hypothetical protein
MCKSLKYIIENTKAQGQPETKSTWSIVVSTNARLNRDVVQATDDEDVVEYTGFRPYVKLIASHLT